MNRLILPCVLLLIGGAKSVWGQALVTEQGSVTEVEPGAGKSFTRAAAGVLGANVLVWAANRYVKDEATARVGTRTWAGNLGSSFGWDPDGFFNNQLGHPYHGGLYYTAARVNGYGYWASIPFTAAGSLMWEYLGETTSPSLNDLINTTLGGMALGEISHRISTRAARGGGAGRRVVATAVSPAGGAQALLGARPGEGPEGAAEPLPEVSPWRLALGYLHQGAELGEPGSVGGFVELGAEERSPFDPGFRRPFDAYRLELEIAAGDPASVTRARASGLLARRFLRNGERSQLVAGVFQEYDYVNLSSHAVGGQSLTGGLLYRRGWGAAGEVRFGAQLRGVALAAIAGDRADDTGRGYDYTSGLGSNLSLSVRHGARGHLRLEHTAQWLWTLDGAYPRHRTRLASAEVEWPAVGMFGVGAHVAVWRHDADGSAMTLERRVPRLRLYLVGPGGWRG